MSVRSSDPCPRLTPVLLPVSLARPTQRQAEASTDETSGWGFHVVSGCSGVSVCLTPTWAYTHTHVSYYTHSCSGLGLMDGCVKRTPLDLGRDDFKCGTSHGLSGRIHRTH